MKKYLAVYYCRGKKDRFIGNAVIGINGKISSDETVMAIEEALKKEKKIDKLVLINIIPLDEDNEVEEQ